MDDGIQADAVRKIAAWSTEECSTWAAAGSTACRTRVAHAHRFEESVLTLASSTEVSDSLIWAGIVADSWRPALPCFRRVLNHLLMRFLVVENYATGVRTT